MGARLSAPSQHGGSRARWSTDDLPPLPCAANTFSRENLSGADTGAADTEVGPLEYAQCCLHALLAATCAEATTPLQWCVPSTVSLAGVFANASRGDAARSRSSSRPPTDRVAVLRLLAQCGAALGHRPLVALCLDGHREITVREVQAWVRLAQLPTTIRAAAPWRQLRSLSLCDCPLSDAGVAALCALLYPLPGKQRAAVAALQQAAEPNARLTAAGARAHARALLPRLEALHLDGVGLSDTGAARLSAHLEAAATAASSRGEGCRHTGSGSASAAAASSTPCPDSDIATRPCLLPYLSVQRNELSGAGVLELVRACTSARWAARASPPLPAVGAVNVAWNSFAAPPSGYSRDGTACLAAQQEGLKALGSGLVSRVQGTTTPLPESGVARSAAQALLLQGCDVECADVRALCVDGLLHTYRDELRALAHQEVRPSRLAAPPSSLISARLVRLELSHNRHLGDTGVRLLLSTMLCLETVCEVTNRPRRPHSHALTQPFQHLETLALRDVGCTETVLGDVLRLLLSNSELAVSALDDVVSTTCDGPAFEEAVQHTLLSEAQLLATLHAEEPTSAVDADDAADRGSEHALLPPMCAYTPNLRLLDLSENVFASPALAGAVLAAAVLRVSRASASGGPLVVGLERCGLTDGTLSHVPFAMEALRPELPAVTVRTSLPLCTWHLGDNALTHAALLRLRRYMDEHASLPLQAEQVCAVRAYVEGNAVAHPCTRLDEFGVGELGNRRASSASRAPVHSGITSAAMADAVHPTGFRLDGNGLTGADVRGAESEAAQLAHAGLCTAASSLEKSTRERVPWTLLPALPVQTTSGGGGDLYAADHGEHGFLTPLAAHPWREAADGRGSLASASVRGSSGFFAAPSIVSASAVFTALASHPDSAALPRFVHGARTNGGAAAKSPPRQSGSSDLLQSATDVVPVTQGAPAAASLPSQRTRHTGDFIDAFIAEAEQVMRERRQFVEDMERQVSAAERHSLGASH